MEAVRIDGILRDPHSRLSTLPTGIKEMLITSLLLDPLKIIKVMNECNNNKLSQLICNNRQFIEAAWNKYLNPIDSKKCFINHNNINPNINVNQDKDENEDGNINKNNNAIIGGKNCKDMSFKQLKELFIIKIKLYEKTVNEILLDNDNKKYKILYNNAKITKEISETSMVDVDKVEKMLNKLSYLDLYFEGRYSNSNLNLMSLAVLGRDYHIIDLLIKKGSDINSKNNEGNTPLLIALSYIRVPQKMFDYLITKNADIFAKNNENNTALIIAAELGEYEIVQYLVKNGLNVNDQNDQGNVALGIAFYNYFISKYLIDNGTNINHQNKKGSTLLMLAFAANNMANIAQYLINKGADLYIKDNEGNTVFDRALKEIKGNRTERICNKYNVLKQYDTRISQLCNSVIYT